MSSASWTPRQGASSVKATIISHLKSWGEYQHENCKKEMSINGYSITNIRIEQAYKGNFHLLANIDN